jgi:hypothetical protein
MSLRSEFHVPDIAVRRFEQRLNSPSPTYAGGWLISFQDGPEVICFDANLDESWRLAANIRRPKYGRLSFALSPDQQFLACANEEGVFILDRKGAPIHSYPHDINHRYTTSGCCFDSRNRLWCVQASDWNLRMATVIVIEPQSGAIIARQAFRCEGGHFAFYPSRDLDTVLLDEACGQDGSFLYVARLTDSELTVSNYGFSDRTFYWGFSADGGEFATGAHRQGSALQIHAFPGGQVIGSAASQTVFSNDSMVSDYPDSIGYQAMFLDENHLVADTRYKRMILLRRDGLQLLGTVWAEGDQLRGYESRGHETSDPALIDTYEAEISYFLPARLGRLLAVYNEHTVRLLDVSSLLAEA